MKNTSVYFYSTQWSPCSSWSSRTEHIRSHKNARRRHEHVTLRTKSYSLNLWIAKSWNNIIKKSISCLNNQICWNQLFLASINFIYVCPFSATLSMATLARMMDSYVDCWKSLRFTWTKCFNCKNSNFVCEFSLWFLLKSIACYDIGNANEIKKWMKKFLIFI